MKLEELFAKLRVLKAEIIYVIHKEEPSFSERMDIKRFEEKLRKAGFFPLIAEDYRAYGKPAVSRAIKRSDFSIVLALDKDTELEARKAGVDFVYIEEL